MEDDELKWQALCAEAAQEINPQRLLQLVSEINSILALRELAGKTKRLPLDETTTQALPSN